MDYKPVYTRNQLFYKLRKAYHKQKQRNVQAHKRRPADLPVAQVLVL
jgi:hypothetical protein